MTCLICLEKTNKDSYDFCCARNIHKKCLDNVVKLHGLKCIICKKVYKKEKVYFAGKINDDNNRGYYYENIIQCKDNALIYPRITICTREEDYKYRNLEEKGKIETGDLNTCFITGPFQCGDSVKPHNTPFGYTEHGEEGNYEFKNNLFNICMKQIDKSDVVVVSINKDKDCHGTFIEMGYAIAKNKPVYVIYEDSDHLLKNFTTQGAIESLKYGDQEQRKIRMYTILSNTYRYFKNEEDYLTKKNK